MDVYAHTEVGGETRTLGPGEVARIPSWVPHRVRAGAGPASQLDVFSPPRADWTAKDDAYLRTAQKYAVACAGATPVAATNCLNFANPEKPHIMWQFSQASSMSTPAM